MKSNDTSLYYIINAISSKIIDTHISLESARQHMEKLANRHGNNYQIVHVDKLFTK